ncbi:MAG TPA: ABC transporter permease [Acidimicrobiales bacterium]|nr:ABC transporter permease [Acidimicrobiales bacterium]
MSLVDLEGTAGPASAGTGPAGGAPRPVNLPSRLRSAVDVRRGGIVIPFVVLFVVLSATSGPFFTKVNLLNILDQQASTLIPAAAGTLVLVAGGLDLSVGAVYALAGVTAAHLALFTNPALACAVGVLVGLSIGLVNGFVATVLRINALIATLAMSYVVSSISGLATGGNIITDFNRPGFADLARSSFLTVHTSTWVTLLVVVAIGFLLSRTTIGRYMYAAGGNAQAARLAGVRVYQVRILAFALSGAAAALGGVIDASRVLSAQSSSGSTLAFTVLAGIVVGGTSILGGVGTVWRSVIGVLFIALVGNGFDLLGLDPLYEQLVLGALLIMAVGLDAWTRMYRA